MQIVKLVRLAPVLALLWGACSSDGEDRIQLATDAAANDANGGDSGTSTDAGVDSGVSSGDCAAIMPTTQIDEDDLAAQVQSLNGTVIAVVGTATVGEQRCSSIPCPLDNPCCNTCSAELTIGGVALGESDCFMAPGCTGNECELTCRPNEAGDAIYIGVVRAGPPATIELVRVEGE